MGTQFIKIPRKFLELDANTKFMDICVYAVIDNYRCEGKSRISMENIAKKLNLNEKRKVVDSIKRLCENGYLKYEQIDSRRYDGYVFNEYSFPLQNDKDGFLMLDTSILNQDMNPKSKGMLIYLQLIALPNMNQIAERDIKDISKLIKVDKRTMSKYLKGFMLSGDITLSRAGFYQCRYLFKDVNEKHKIGTEMILD